MIEKKTGWKSTCHPHTFRGEIRNLEGKTSPLFYPHKKNQRQTL